MPAGPCWPNPATSQAPPAPGRTSWEAEAGEHPCPGQLGLPLMSAPQLCLGPGPTAALRAPGAAGALRGGTGQVGALLGSSVLLRGTGGNSGIYSFGTWTRGVGAEPSCGQRWGAGRTHLAGPWIACALACPRSPSSSAGRRGRVSGKTELPDARRVPAPALLGWVHLRPAGQGKPGTRSRAPAWDPVPCACSAPPGSHPTPGSREPGQGAHHRRRPH